MGLKPGKSTVNITPVKRWVSTNLSQESRVRGLIMAERDMLSVEEYIAKIDTWIKLLRLETG
jgi:hypothetical protein